MGNGKTVMQCPATGFLEEAAFRAKAELNYARMLPVDVLSELLVHRTREVSGHSVGEVPTELWMKLTGSLLATQERIRQGRPVGVSDRVWRKMISRRNAADQVLRRHQPKGEITPV